MHVTNILKTLKEAIKGLLNMWLDALLPPVCFSCKTPTQVHGTLCADCWRQTRFITKPKCQKCGVPFAHADLGKHCNSCHQSPPSWVEANSAVTYNKISRKLILRFKHGDQPYLGEILVNFSWPHVKSTFEIPDINALVPVPIHTKRRLKRKYNQAALLALYYSKKSKIPFLHNSLRRHRATDSQGQLNKAERLSNMEGAFFVPEKERAKLIGKTLILIDDVLTTGATAEACTQTLLKAGAKAVYVVTFARVPLPDEEDDATNEKQNTSLLNDNI